MKPSALERALGLRFKNKKLLEQALAHPSFLNESKLGEGPEESYERLEFLGDAVVEVVVTVELYKRCPELSEGQLTKLRSSLVRGRTLARVARVLEVGPLLKLGKGEESSGGRERDSNLAAVFEALVGAAFLDRGYESTRKMAVRLMSEEMGELLAGGVPEDPKSLLQEAAQSKGGSPPQYRLVDAGGPDHARGFNVEVVLGGQVMGYGQGRRKLDAEKQAAQEALNLLDSP